MLVKLNEDVEKQAPYDPPVEVTRHFTDPNRDAPASEQIEFLMWIPAAMVSRFLFQFPFLRDEADELFSIGVEVVAEKVADQTLSGSIIGSHITTLCMYRMEEYANSLDSVVNTSTRTRYTNFHRGKETPRNSRLTHDTSIQPDNHEVILADAVRKFGKPLDEMNLTERRELARMLGLPENKFRKRDK